MPILSSVAFATAKAYGFGSPDLFAGAALSLAFDETTTLDSRITFTRATDGTYFDSAGTLQTASSGVARFDHRLEGGVWVNKGLLIEEQRANICLRSEDFSTTWANTNTTETVNTTAAPNGATTADSIFETTTTGSHVIYQVITVDMISTTYTGSVFVKANGRTKGDIQVLSLGAGNPNFISSFDLTAGTITAVAGSGTPVSQSIEDVGNGWYRVSISGYTGQSGSHRLQIGIRNDSNQASYAGNTSKGLILWGAQLEAGAFPTSYIATTTASVTRNQDVVTMTSTNFSSWFNATEGTIYCLWDNIGFNPVNNYVWQIDDTTSNERYYLAVNNTSAFNDIVDGNVSQVTGFNSSYTPALYQSYDNALAYKANDFATSFNGVTPVTDNSGSLPTVTRLVLGEAQTTATRPLNGHIAKFYYWNTRKPDSFLQTVTG